MRFSAEISGDLKRIADRQRAITADQARGAVETASAQLQGELRSQVSAAGLGNRLANAWRRRVYPQSGERSLSPAALVWAKAGSIIRAYAEGTVITAKGGRALAIPSEFVPLKATRRPMTPAEVEARFGRKLRYVPLRNGNAVLIMDQLVAGRSGGFRPATKRRQAQGRKVTSKIMFTLVRQVKVKKRLDIERAAAGAEAALTAGLSAIGNANG
jgi:uncharacterized protein DUF6441